MTRFFCVLIILGITQTALASNCDRLGNTIKISYPTGFGGVVHAGEDVAIKLSVDISDTEALKAFPMVPLSFRLINRLPGSNAVGEDALWLKEDEASEIPAHKDFDLRLKIPSNFVGRYVPETVIAVVGNGEWCGKQFDDSGVMIDVVNDSTSADIVPPVISAVAIDKDQFLLGEEAMLTIRAHDQSAICTEEKKTAGQCQAVWHIAFKELNSNGEANVYEPMHDGTKTGEYIIRFSVKTTDQYSQSQFKVGTYRVEGINVYDIWGNASVDLAPSLKKTFQVFGQ